MLGVGSVGSVVAACLAQTEHEIHLHVRGERGAQLMVEGLSVSGFGLENIPSERYIFSCEELELPPVLENGSDIVVLACKSHVVPELSRLATTLLTEDGIVLALTNGLGHVETLSRVVGPQHVMAAVTTHGAFMEADGHVTWAGQGTIGLAIPPLGPSGVHLERLVNVVDSAGLSPSVNDDAAAMIWEKVLLNVTINPIAALAGLLNGELLEAGLFGTCMMVYREAAQVAALERVNVPDEALFEQRLREVLEQTKENACSMLQDIKAGRRTEIDALNQAVVLRAEEHGYAAPLNQLLATLIRACHA